MSNSIVWVCGATCSLLIRKAWQVEIIFCCTNVDLHSLEEFRKLERLGLSLQVVPCLGLCHWCAQSRMALVDDTVVVADDPEAFWRALLGCSLKNETSADFVQGR